MSQNGIKIFPQGCEGSASAASIVGECLHSGTPCNQGCDNANYNGWEHRIDDDMPFLECVICNSICDRDGGHMCVEKK